MLEIWLAGVHVLGTAAAYGQAAEAEASTASVSAILKTSRRTLSLACAGGA
jgi:hypothetical protein